MMKDGIPIDRIRERVDPRIVFRRVIGEVPSHSLGQDKIGKLVPFGMGLKEHRAVQQDRDGRTPQQDGPDRIEWSERRHPLRKLGRPLGLATLAAAVIGVKRIRDSRRGRGGESSDLA